MLGEGPKCSVTIVSLSMLKLLVFYTSGCIFLNKNTRLLLYIEYNELTKHAFNIENAMPRNMDQIFPPTIDI